MAVLFTAPFVTALNLSGLPISGATLTFYTTGTSTLAAVYANSALTVALTNPVVTDAAGRFPAIYLATATAYRAVLRDAGGAVIRDTDPVSGSLASSVTVSLFDFIDPSLYAAIWARTYTGDLSSQLQAAINAADGRSLYFPGGKFPYATPLVVGKGQRIRLIGAHAPNDAAPGATIGGSELYYTGTTGAGLTVGVADGNPDTTGYTQSFEAENIVFSTPFGSGGNDGILIQNTQSFRVNRCKFRGYKRRCINLYGGNVTGYIGHNDVLGTGVAGCDGIYLDVYQFGNFDITIERNHVVQLDRAMVFTQGRYLRVLNNTCENLNIAQYEFIGSASIGLAVFMFNSSEQQKGYVFKGDAFTGAILKLVDIANECFGSSDATHVNPGYGNLNKAVVFEHVSDANFILDATRNANVLAPSVFPSTSPFNPTTTACLGNQTNIEYADDLVASLRGKELIGVAGTLAAFDGTTTPGTYPTIVTGGKPIGWTNLLSTGSWALIADSIAGGPTAYAAASTATDCCSIALTLTPVARIRYFAVGLTARGWVQAAADGTSIFDAGLSIAKYLTLVLRFSVPVSAASTTFKLMRPTGQALLVGEAQIYEIGTADYNNAAVLSLAIPRLMKRGIYT